ncbi:MAG: glycosyltransferase family 2 protein, partial [Geobacteraceae bacterium]|nr:glycosyltransferase family 2 protein [Geobacteraceae bacterium]
MTNQPLVSIITPCYNGDKYLYRFFDSILAQTYRNIELIFVNDGSTDKTEEVALSYKDRLESSGVRLVYIYQDNKGLAGAINAGLANMSGKYFCWPDSDDYFEATSIEKRVCVLENFTDYAVVTSDAYIRDIDSMEEPIGVVSNNNSNRFLSNQFEFLIIGESIFCSGCHMMRADVFRDTHPDGQIYNARRGQNWQMLLPVYYKHKRYFLDEPLYNY